MPLAGSRAVRFPDGPGPAGVLRAVPYSGLVQVCSTRSCPKLWCWPWPAGPEPGRLVDAARRGQAVLSPERDLLIARRPGEPQALLDQPAADAQAAGPRLDEQQPQLCGGGVLAHAEHAPGRRAVHLGDPCRLPSPGRGRPRSRPRSWPPGARKSRPSSTPARTARRAGPPPSPGRRAPAGVADRSAGGPRGRRPTAPAGSPAWPRPAAAAPARPAWPAVPRSGRPAARRVRRRPTGRPSSAVSPAAVRRRTSAA